MKFPEPLVEGRLIRRYKRFLADVQLPDGTKQPTVPTPVPCWGASRKMPGCG